MEVVKFLNENCKDNYFSDYDIEGTLIHSKNEEIKEYIRNYIMKNKEALCKLRSSLFNY